VSSYTIRIGGGDAVVDVQLLLDEDLGGWRVGASEGPPGRGSLGCVAGGAMGATTSYQGYTAPGGIHISQFVERVLDGGALGY